MIWFLFFVAVSLFLAYTRPPLKQATIGFGAAIVVYGLFGGSLATFLALAVAFAAIAIPVNMVEVRQEWISRPAMNFFRKVLPEISDTERTALDAGTVWWDGELFSGRPNWARLASMPRPVLSPEEQSFLDNQVNTFCAMLDEWQITHVEQDLPAKAWDYLKKEKFFGMIIPREYGGLEFSAFAHSQVLARVSSSAGGATAGSIVAVPNSLGPAELLVKYGTDEQKNHYLPRLATGDDIPCFGLTSPYAGSDAGSIPDKGVICKGKWQGKDVLGMRLTFDKRYITLAPVATVVGLAFKLYDPENLIGDTEELGITCALIPSDTPGLEIGKRHLPLNNPFVNGPIRGTDIFVPLDYIIGGQQMAGEGWRMLMECLSVGRSISLPSNSTGTALTATASSGAYARVRRQFNIPIGQFEGIQEALGEMGATAYAAESVRRFTSHAVDLGEKPSVPSAIAKMHCTEMSQRIAKLAMDVHAGKGVMLGPSNWIGRNFQGTPISITVEGANILTRNMMIFGQGAIRCHPYVLEEIAAVNESDGQRALTRFDAAFTAHVGHGISVAARSLVLGVTQGLLADSPTQGPTRRHYQRIARYSANLALLSDLAMASLGGSLKFRERLSARLGDLLSMIYIASATLKRFEDDGSHPDDLPFVDAACQDCFVRAEAAIDGFLRNLPSRPTAAIARLLVLPTGRRAKPARDAVSNEIAEALQEPGATRDRHFAITFAAAEDQPLGQLGKAMAMSIECEPLERRVLKAIKGGQLKQPHPIARLDEAVTAGVLNADDAAKLRACYELAETVCRVDEFDTAEIQAGGKPAASRRSKGTNTKAKASASKRPAKAAPRKSSSTAKKSTARKSTTKTRAKPQRKPKATTDA